LSRHGVRIRDIWIADCAWQGQSGILNQEQGLLGNDRESESARLTNTPAA
jgi:hypothetical protein